MPSIYSGKVKNWQARLDYTITQSITANKSTISCQLYVQNTGGNYNNDANSAYCRFMRGTSYDSGIMYRTYSWPDAAWHFVASYSFVVPHNADGTKTIELTGYWCSDNETQWTPYALDARGTITLPTIPRMSSISFGKFTMGKAGRITINRQSSAFRDTLAYTFGSASGTIASKTGAGYVDWTPPTSLANHISNAPSGTGEIILTTYNGATTVGSRHYPFTVTVPTDAAPSIKATLSDAGRGVKLVGAYVQHQSRLRVQLAGTAKYGASIKSYSASAGGTQASAQSATFDLPVSGQIKVAYSCTDSRGKSGSGSQTITVLPWTAPGVTAIAAVRCNAQGVEDPVGDYAKVTFSARVAPLNNKNNASYQVKYRKAGSGAAWSSVAVPGAEGQYSPAGVSIIIPAPTSDGLEICVSAKDIYKQTDSLIVTMSSAQAFFRTNAAMTGITWGEEKVIDDVFRVGGQMRAEFTQPVRCLGGIERNVLTERDNLNAITQSGFYYWGDFAIPNGPPEEWGSSGRWCELTVAGDCQEAVSLATGVRMQRRKKAGQWLPWECVNPPMEEWTEYRTTERFFGKPVYTKLVVHRNVSISTDITNFTFSHRIENFKVAVGITGRVWKYQLPHILDSRYTVIREVTPEYIGLSLKNDAWGNDLTWWFVIKYTKTTD